MSSSKEVGEFFDGYASGFDSLYGHSDKRGIIGRFIDRNFRAVMKERFAKTLFYTGNSDISSVLDIGCGPGHYCLEFVKQGKKVMGIDIAEEMLKIADRKTKSTEGDIEYIHANYEHYILNEKFDAACLMGFFDYIQNPVSIFNKLKKDINTEIYSSFPKNKGFLIFQRKIRYYLRGCPLFTYTKKDIQEMMSQSEIDNYEIQDLGRDFFLKINL